MGKKYVAYVGTYTHGTSKGIQVLGREPGRRYSHREK